MPAAATVVDTPICRNYDQRAGSAASRYSSGQFESYLFRIGREDLSLGSGKPRKKCMLRNTERYDIFGLKS